MKALDLLARGFGYTVEYGYGYNGKSRDGYIIDRLDGTGINYVEWCPTLEDVAFSLRNLILDQTRGK